MNFRAPRSCGPGQKGACMPDYDPSTISQLNELGEARDGDHKVCWDVLQRHPFIGASMVDSSGAFHWANARAKMLYLGDASVNVRGKTIYDFFSKEWCDERVGLMRELDMTGKPAVLRHIRRGRSLMVSYNHAETPEGEPQRYLILISEAFDGAQNEVTIPEDYIVFDTGLMNLGPLDALSRREIEVLALISQGLTTDEIAKELSRSPKTIEAHRSSIARKLGVKNRVQLAEIAIKAALEIRHADLKRVPD